MEAEPQRSTGGSMRGLIPIFALGAIRTAREPDETWFGADLPVEPVSEVAGGTAEKVE
jgi:hypothetical protein